MSTDKQCIKVSGHAFEWETEKGRFLFEGEDSILFWISSAMKSFFDNIEEVSGAEATNVVLETSGYRQGAVVGDYFKTMGISLGKMSGMLTGLYASAGWGRIYLKDLDVARNTFSVHLQDDWEYKINVAQCKKSRSSFLPAHFAGMFSVLFGTNLWFQVVEEQTENNKMTVVNYFPSTTTITENIHRLTRKKEEEQINRLKELVEIKTQELRELVTTLSSPMIPVLDGIVVVPLLGKYDDKRAEELFQKTLHNLHKNQTQYLILDLTGLNEAINESTGIFLERLASAASLTGTKTLLVGISPILSMKISQSEIDFSKFDCFKSLQYAIYYALGQSGRRIV